MNRTRETPNADPERRSTNATYTPASGWVMWASRAPRDLGEQLRERLADFEQRGGKLRKDSVLSIELMLSASPDWFKHASREQTQEWLRRNIEWIEDTFGRDNVLQVALHMDETTPHLHAFVLPEVQMVETRGRKPKPGSPASVKTPKPALAASHWLDGRVKMGELQDRYAAAMATMGLKRGLKGSGARHRTIRSYYAAAEAVMGQEPGAIRIPAPPPLPEPRGWLERMGAAVGLVPRAAAMSTAQKAARAAALEAEQRAKEARAAAIEAHQQRRQLEARFRAVGGAEGIERAEGLEAQMEALQRQQEQRLADAREQLELVRAELQEALQERAADAELIHELREWGQRLEAHAETLEGELYGEPDSGLSMG